MELLLVLTFALASLAVALVHRHQKVVAWDRELDAAFGDSSQRELPRHRTL
jgi:hypothetical protein